MLGHAVIGQVSKTELTLNLLPPHNFVPEIQLNPIVYECLCPPTIPSVSLRLWPNEIVSPPPTLIAKL
jgi:hypothetical protein